MSEELAIFSERRFKMHRLLLTLTEISWLCFSQTIYVGIPQWGVQKSMDNSYTWFSVNEDLPNLNVNCLGGIKYTMNDGTRYDLYAGASTGLYRSTHGGVSWQFICTGLPNVITVKVDPSNKNTIYACSIAKIARSTDWGETWVDITPPTNTTLADGRGFDISPDNRNELYAFGLNDYYLPYPVTMYDLYKSSDMGETWNMISQRVMPFTGGPRVGALKIDPQTSQRMYFNEYAVTGTLFRSTDWGVSWEECPNIAFVNTFLIDSLQSNILYVGLKENAGPGEAGVYKSTDYGNSWNHTGLNTTNVHALAQDIINGSKIYAGGVEQIGGIAFYVSTNGGGEWRSYSTGLPPQGTVKTINPTDFQKESYTANATVFSARKLVYSTFSDRFWLSYNGHNRIIVATAEDILSSLQKKDLGQGEYPCICLDAGNNTCVVWQRNIAPTPVIAGGELWFSRFDGTNWTEPYFLASFTGPYSLDVNLPSFTIDSRTNTGYVVFEFRDRFINGPTSHLYLGWFDINNPANIQFQELEFAIAPVRCEFPSVSLGGNYLYIAFQREDRIYRIKWDIVNHQIVNRILVSEDGRLSHHPYVDVQANGVVNYVWEDSTANNIDIYRQYEGSPFLPVPVVETPGKSQWPQICKGTTWITWSEFIYPPTDNNWEICYKDMEYEGYQILSQTLEMSKYSHGVVTHSPYWPPPYEPKLTAIWTEGNQAPYEIRVKTVALPEIPFFYADAGKEYLSPWTVQREGFIQFASEPEKTIDYHPTKLIYHFPNLNREKRYRIKLVFYFESQSQDRWKMKIDADNIFHTNLWINPGEVTSLERWLPTTCYKDGEVYLNIKKIIGDYALVAQIFIYEYERETEEVTKNTQESGSLPANEPGIFIRPNPVHSTTSISYSLPNNTNEPVNLKIYDASGRMVRQWDYETIRLSDNISWNGTDETGKALSNGIYFVILETGKNHLTQKIILLR
jgi:photosystem II stability/assembly factor-like uncharacterized protein